MSKYKILWIDDKWKEMDSFKEVCELPENDIEVVPCTNAEEGMEIFEARLEEWSGVVLDAKVFKGRGSEVDRLEGLDYSRKRISELKHKRYVPTYIFTGQPDLISWTNFADLVGKFYEKAKDDEELIVDIKRNADELVNTQIIHRHRVVFDTWPESRTELLRLLKVMEAEDWKDNSFFVDIRKVLSDVMSRLYKCGYCSVEHDGSNLGDCSRALGLPNMSDIIPVYIQRSLHTCVEVTNPGCHRTECDSAVKEGRAPYLIRSLVFDLLNILYWCKDLPPEKDREKTAQRVKQSMEEFDRKKEESQNRKRQRYIQQD